MSVSQVLQNHPMQDSPVQASAFSNGDGGLLVREQSGWGPGEDDPLDEEEELRDTWGNRAPMSTDFSQPRPFSASDIQTLPSMYEPQTGATRYTNGSETAPPDIEEIMSLESRYPATEAGIRESEIGGPSKSGTGQAWSQGEVPPLPEKGGKGARR